jgi:hypothetical protein
LWLSCSLTGAALPVLVFKVRLLKGALTGHPEGQVRVRGPNLPQQFGGAHEGGVA